VLFTAAPKAAGVWSRGNSITEAVLHPLVTRESVQ